MSDPVRCHHCAGNGCVPVQICCGKPIIGAEYMEAQCCGDPDEDMEMCHVCKGNGELPRPWPRYITYPLIAIAALALWVLIFQLI